VAIIAQKAREAVRFAHAVLDEVQRIRGYLPVRDERRHVGVDGDVGVLVNGLPDAAQIPPILVALGVETRKVERLLGGDDEVIADPRILADDPSLRLWEQEAIVTPASSRLRHSRMRRVHQGDAAVRVDSEYRVMRVDRRAVVHPHSVTPLKHRLVTTVEPDACLER
jgi:hypothetical protein